MQDPKQIRLCRRGWLISLIESSTAVSLLSNPAKLSTMREKALLRARPTAAADIAAHIIDLIGRQLPHR